MTAVLDAVGRIDQRWLLVALLLVLDLWAVTLVVLSRVGRREKVLWCGVIFLCPIVGCLFWFVLGPKAERPGPAGLTAPDRGSPPTDPAPGPFG